MKRSTRLVIAGFATSASAVSRSSPAWPWRGGPAGIGLWNDVKHSAVNEHTDCSEIAEYKYPGIAGDEKCPARMMSARPRPFSETGISFVTCVIWHAGIRLMEW